MSAPWDERIDAGITPQKVRMSDSDVYPGRHDQAGEHERPALSSMDSSASSRVDSPSTESTTPIQHPAGPRTGFTGDSANREGGEAEADDTSASEQWDQATVTSANEASSAQDGEELHSIMAQFSQSTRLATPESEPKAAQQRPISDVGYFPARSSSITSKDGRPESESQRHSTQVIPDGTQIARVNTNESGSTLRMGSSIFKPPPPSPDPDSDLPFDFHRFLEQLRHRTADPVARFLRSFLLEFGKKQWMVHEQVKIISDFLEFITKKMSQCEVWQTVTDAEFDNAREGMEKLVMNRLYSQTFSPAIPALTPPSNLQGKRRARVQAQSAAIGRKGQHQEDVERDELVAQKIRIYGWIEPQHLDVPGVSDKGRKFLLLAQQELLKINSYRAPRDKIICVLNCCKVIFGYLKSRESDQSADAFVPLLILTVLHAAPEHLVSNVQYIHRFRNQDKLGGEAGYYISSLMGVLSFVENIDRTNLVVSDEEFEQHVEAAVSAITSSHSPSESLDKSADTTPPLPQNPIVLSPGAQLHPSDKSALSKAEVTPRHSSEAERISPRRNASARLSEKESGTSSPSESTVASGILRSFSKPLSSIGRMFSDDSNASKMRATSAQSVNKGDPAPRPETASNNNAIAVDGAENPFDKGRDIGGIADAESRRASAEMAEAQRLRAKEHRIVVE